jgi:hypothetical protein
MTVTENVRHKPPHHNCAKPLRLYGAVHATPTNRQTRGLPRIDGRTRAGRIARAFRQDLIDHVGGSPNIIEREIIERCVFLQLKCSLMDAKICAGKESEYDSKTYLAWSASLQRSLLKLGYQENVEIMRKRAETNLLKAYQR